MPAPKFVAGEPALLLDKCLIISDLHLGIEYEWYKAGITIPSQLEKTIRRLESLIQRTQARTLIITGDVKHKITGVSFQEERELPLLFSRLLKQVDIDIVLGNHDPDIERVLPPGVAVHPTAGILRGNAYLSHGHTWPTADVEKAEYIIIGHNQPLIEFRDRLGFRWVEQVWIRAPLKKEALRKKYPGMKHPPELIVIPAFNELAGGICVNRETELMGPVMKLADLKKARIYLLDGTDLGELGKLRDRHF